MSSSSCAEDSAISSSRTLIKGQQAALDCSDDFAAEWQRCRASGESWGGRGRGGRGVARQYACTSSATRDVRVDNVTLAYAGLELLLPCALRISHGQRYALIGRNGCGKSSLLERIASGSLPGFPQHLRVGILHQMSEQLSCSSLRAVDACLQLGAQSRRWDLEDEREQLQTAMSEEGSAEDADITFLVQARTLLCSATCAHFITPASAIGRHRHRAGGADRCPASHSHRRSFARIGLQRFTACGRRGPAQRWLAHARAPCRSTALKTRHIASGRAHESLGPCRSGLVAGIYCVTSRMPSNVGYC